jgi:hypothetical protein
MDGFEAPDRRGRFPLRRIPPAAIASIVFRVGLTALASAQSPCAPGNSAEFAKPSLLPTSDDFPVSRNTLLGSRRRLIEDQSVNQAVLPAQIPSNLSARLEGPSAPPDLEPLPSAGSQAGAGQPPPAEATRPLAPNPPQPASPAQPAQRDRRVPARPAPADAEQQIQFDRGGLVTMHVNELDVRQLLELLSRRSGLNILVSPKVSGTVTANFEGTTVQDVLKAIIKLANLVGKQKGQFITFTPRERSTTTPRLPSANAFSRVSTS